MRISIVLLTCLILAACGKTGALYLPEDADTQQSDSTTPEKAE